MLIRNALRLSERAAMLGSMKLKTSLLNLAQTRLPLSIPANVDSFAAGLASSTSLIDCVRQQMQLFYSPIGQLYGLTWMKSGVVGLYKREPRAMSRLLWGAAMFGFSSLLDSIYGAYVGA